MDEKMDHGPVITQFKEEILPDDNMQTLRDRIFEKSADVLTQMLPAYIQGKINPKVQKENDATFTKLLKKEDGFISLKEMDRNDLNVHNFIRGMAPWPGAWTRIQLMDNSGQHIEKRLKILKSHLEASSSPTNYSLVLDEVQLEGKGPVSWKQFKDGYKGAEFI